MLFASFSTLLGFCVAASGQPARPQVPPETVVHKDLVYVQGGHERQKLDLYIPREGTNLPLVIYIHGGAWLGGSKDWGAPLQFLKDGYAVASINYRLSQHAIFPAQIQDCKAAVRWLRAHAGQYRLNAQRFAVMGESAGGHLAALVGTSGQIKDFDVGENLDVSCTVQAVVDYFGPTDLLQIETQRKAPLVMGQGGDSPESKLMGGGIQEKKDLAARANPITFVTSNSPPFLICHGDADPLVPHQQSELLEAALKKAGVPVTFYTVKGGSHGGFRDPKVPELTREFLRKYLKGS